LICQVVGLGSKAFSLPAVLNISSKGTVEALTKMVQSPEHHLVFLTARQVSDAPAIKNVIQELERSKKPSIASTATGNLFIAPLSMLAIRTPENYDPSSTLVAVLNS